MTNCPRFTDNPGSNAAVFGVSAQDGETTPGEWSEARSQNSEDGRLLTPELLKPLWLSWFRLALIPLLGAPTAVVVVTRLRLIHG